MHTSLSKRLMAVPACVLIALSSTTASAGDRPERDFDADVVRAIEKAEAGRLAKRVAATPPDTSGFDVVKYTIGLNVDFSGLRLDANVRIDAQTTAPNVSTVALDFEGFSVTSVQVNGTPAPFTRSGGALRVDVGPFASVGQTFSITVAYAGQPSTQGGLGFGFTPRGAATFAEPEGARLWFPSKDRPSDKAQYEGFITVPQGQVVASNGRLVEVTDAPGGRKTYHWLEEHPIATYLIMLGISDYRILEQQAGTIPIRHYVYPDHASAAQRDFSRTPDMMAAFEHRLGVPYPFDKYGHAIFENFGGAMEHQTMTSYGSRLITGDNRYDRVVAHELGHHWFGDMVSPAEWEEIWLNEGFATWTEFLWTEHSDPDFLEDLMAGRETYYMDYEAGAGRIPLYGPGMGRLFAPTIYQKGGWVVAMLRYIVGDEAFFAGLRSYLETNAFGNGTTQGLKSAMEASSGMDLEAFFDEWVYGVGYPTYVTSWSSRAVGDGRYQADLRVVQTQRGSSVFTTPLEVEVAYGDGTTTRQRIAISSADQFVSLCLDAAPTRVTVDPDNRVLGTVSTSGNAVAAQPALCGDEPDPVTIVVTGVSLVRSKGKRQLEVTGTGFVAGDSRIEVDGTQLAKTKYPAGGGATRLIGQNARLTKEIIPKGATVQVTVVNVSTGERSVPFAFTRTP